MADNDEKFNKGLDEVIAGIEEPGIEEQLAERREKRRLAKNPSLSPVGQKNEPLPPLNDEPLPDLDDEPDNGPEDEPEGEGPLLPNLPNAGGATVPEKVSSPAEELPRSTERRRDHISGLDRISDQEQHDLKHRPKVEQGPGDKKRAAERVAKAREKQVGLTEGGTPEDLSDDVRKYNPLTEVTVASAKEQREMRGVREGGPPRMTSEADKARRVAAFKKAQADARDREAQEDNNELDSDDFDIDR